MIDDATLAEWENDLERMSPVYAPRMRDAIAEIRRLRGEASELRQAIGLATTAKPSMIIRPNDPIGMMQEVVADLAAYQAVAPSSSRRGRRKVQAAMPKLHKILLLAAVGVFLVAMILSGLRT